MVDLQKPVSFRGQDLNTVTITAGKIVGCQIDTFDDTEVAIRQFVEPMSLINGIDVGRVWLGSRSVRMRGTVYGSTRADARARLAAISAVMLPGEGTFGLYELGYDLVAGSGPAYMARPNGLRVLNNRRSQGGPSASPLAISWEVSFLVTGATQVVGPPVFFQNWDYTTRDAATSWQAYSNADPTDHVVTSTLGLTWNPDEALRSRRYISWVVPADVRYASFTFTPSTGNNSSHSSETHMWEMRQCSYGAGTPAYATGETGTLLASGDFPWNYDTQQSVADFAVTAGGYLQLCMTGYIVNPIGVSCTIRAGSGDLLGSWWK